MTSPRTTLIRGHYAPLSDRTSEAPHCTLPYVRLTVFLRRDLRQWADYHAHSSLDKAQTSVDDENEVQTCGDQQSGPRIGRWRRPFPAGGLPSGLGRLVGSRAHAGIVGATSHWAERTELSSELQFWSNKWPAARPLYWLDVHGLPVRRCHQIGSSGRVEPKTAPQGPTPPDGNGSDLCHLYLWRNS
jgi:hypothetical protein